MKKLSETYKELGIAFSFPIEIEDGNGNTTYFEYSDGFWHRREYDSRGNRTYYESSNGYWFRSEYGSKGNRTYFEDRDGERKGTPRSAKTCSGKVVEVDGIKYKLKAL